MDSTLIIVVVLLVAAIALGSRSKKKKKPEPDKAGWHIGPDIRGTNYSVGMPKQPQPIGNGWRISFPTNPNHHVHYVQLFSPPALVGRSEITARFSVTGGGFVPQEYPSKPALVSLLIQRKGDDWGGLGAMQSYRWFSNLTVPLEAGEFEITVPLAVEAWGDIYGAKDPALFAAALREAENVAIIFGSDGGRGHGVYATQPSTFTLKELVVK